MRAYDPGYLREALDSLWRQTDPSWRLCLIAEPEDVYGLRAELAAELADPRMEIVANEGRKLAGALNTGMRRSETEFAAILFADDLWAPEAVEVARRHVAEHPDVDFFHSSRVIIDDDGRRISSVRESVQRVAPEDFVTWSPVKHLLCWRVSTALEAGGMDESLNSVGPDDWDFPWSLAERGARFMAIREPLYLYRDHRRCFRLSTHLPLSVHEREIRRIMRKHGVSRAEIRRRINHDRAAYLRQCLYNSRLDRWFRRLTGAGPRSTWRETYL